jgi:hypothetical protein
MEISAGWAPVTPTQDGTNLDIIGFAILQPLLFLAFLYSADVP